MQRAVRADFPPPSLLRIPNNRAGTAGPEIVEVAGAVGIELDGHQHLVLDAAASEKADGTWAASQVGFWEPRQNGKSQLLMARTVAGVLLFSEPHLIYSSHEVKTNNEQYRRLQDLCLNYDVLRRRVKRVHAAAGREGFEFYGEGPDKLTDITRVSFMARTGRAGRGFTASTAILDEAMQLSFATLAAILPTLSAVPNHQIWFAGTPPTPDMNGEVARRLRQRAQDGTSPRLVWVEWSSGPDPANRAAYDYTDPAHSYASNPALVAGRITMEAIQDEMASMDEETFRRDRHGEWAMDGGLTVVPQGIWDMQTDPEGVSRTGQVLAIDVNPARSITSIALAGWTSAEETVRHVELLAQGPGTDWAGPFLRDTLEANPEIRAVIVDGGSPADGLSEALENVFKIRVTRTNARQMAMACGQMYDAFMQGAATHSGQAELTSAMVGSVKRDLLDSWALSRKRAEVDISAFVGATLALYGVTLKKVVRPRVGRRGARK